MTVYVDEPTDYGSLVEGYALRHGTVWSHMTADTEDELIAFALSIGLKRGWLQHAGTPRVHFDVIPSKRALAIRRGAVEVTAREIALQIRARISEESR